MKVILIILDRFNNHVSPQTAAYLLAQCRANKGHLRHIQSKAPNFSLPFYETLLTSQTTTESDIAYHKIMDLSQHKSIFHYAKALGKKSAAAASHRLSENYNHTPFEPINWQFIINPSFTIPYGIFHYDAHYPDSHTFADGEYLRINYDPDFLLIHPRSSDDLSDPKYKQNPAQYRHYTWQIDEVFTRYLPTWLQEGYQVFIAADNTINRDKIDDRNFPQKREIPLFIFGDCHHLLQTEIVQHTDICPIICQLLKENYP